MKKIMKHTAILLVVLAMASLCFACTPEDGGETPLTKTVTNLQVYQKDYSLKELALIESSSFRSLNEVTYPSGKWERYDVSDVYKENMSSFAGAVYGQLCQEGAAENFSFSPMTLYNLLYLASIGSDDPVALAAFESLLGQNENQKEDFIAAYKNDFYSVEEGGTTQQYNGVFLTDSLTPNASYIDQLTECFAEAYQMDFTSPEDVQKMLDWVDQKTGEQGFLKEEDLRLREDIVAYLFSTLYFDNKWASVFTTEYNYEGTFYGATEKQTTFMKHSYRGLVYDYGDYITCYDYYKCGMKVKYITPKNRTDDIYALTANANIFADDETKQILPSDGNRPVIVVNLSVPKFENECMLDLTKTLQNVGLSYLFDESGASFNKMFSDLPDPYNTYFTSVQQKNKISFSEDGTLIKSVAFAGVGGATSAAPARFDTIDITLDSPFIYIVYDNNGLPLYVGHVDMP